MKKFMDKDFLLTTDTAKHLYHDYASPVVTPVLDYHCHINPQEIYEDRKFENITQVWLGADHYKWRQMRSNGVEERYITGDATDREKFQKWAETLEMAIGNPLYHWSHLELQRYFGYEGYLNGETAEEVWNLTSEKLKEESMSVRGIIEKSNVAFIGTTDDPIDSLEYHQKIREEGKLKAVVAPSFRPDKAFNLNMDGYSDYIRTLSEVSGVEINSVASLKTALKNRMDHFNACGCKASDHGINFPVYEIMSEEEMDKILLKAISGQKVEEKELFAVQTEMLLFCAGEYYNLGWAMQIHYNCLRNPNSAMFAKIGPDTGFDCIGPNDGCRKLSALLDRLYREESLPRTVIYSLDASDNAFIDTIIGAFQGTEVPGKLQHGSAWWFNDNKTGMKDQLISLANLSILGNFVGMLTDSRSFLSYTRHEYFRRILCALIGEWVENGEYPNDEKMLGDIIRGICYENAKRYFEL